MDGFSVGFVSVIIFGILTALTLMVLIISGDGSQPIRQHIVNQCTERGGVMVDTWLGYSRHNINENELRIGDYVCLKLERIKK